jgi:hypothetical protein
MLASALAVVASSAMAASSVDIQVTGKIVPSSCTPAFISGGGIAIWHDKCVFTEFHRLHHWRMLKLFLFPLPAKRLPALQ